MSATVTVSDGITSVSIENCTIDDDLQIEESDDITSGGRITSQQSGKRYIVTLKNARLTQAGYASLVNLLSNGANYYTYEPSEIPDLLSSSDFPMAMRFKRPKKNDQAWNGGLIFYFDMECEGIEYV